jgi:M6 family metalloprotease-like protein
VVTQSDQTQITIVGKGNMNNNWTESIDGYTLVRNSNDIYEYANLVNGKLQASGVKARDPQSRTAAESNFVNSLNTSLKPSLNPLKGSVLSQVRKQIQNKTYPTSGHIRVLALLIEYPDLQNTYPKSNFDSLLYGSNYNVGHGSFKTFYEISSDSQLTITVDVMGWFMADSNYIYYSNDSGSSRAADLVREAVDAAELAGANYANYDNDNDGDVDGILAVHSGPGAESGSRTQYIWSHRWVLNGGTQGAVFYDGVWVNDYMINPETRGTLTNPRMVDVGVFCHEFGHNIGLPDLYDTDNSNGDSEGIGNWGLMSGGTWLGNGHFPANFCAWSRIENGWETPTQLTIGNSGSYTMNPASLTPNEIYQINTQNNNEYFLLENRQQRELDSLLPGTGLAIWHINTNKTNFGNRVNADENLKGVDLEEADGNDDLDLENNRGDNGDLYPGSSSTTRFDDNTYPSAQTYTSSNTGLVIRNITETGLQVSFDFGLPVSASCSGTTTLTANNGSFSDGSGATSNYTNNLNCSWLIQPTTTAQSITLSFSSFDTEATNDSVTVYDGVNSSAPIIGIYSGSSTPSNVTSSGGDLYIEFNTNGSTTAQGWSASYTSTPLSTSTCSGSSTLTTTTGTILDGSGASNYSNNLSCRWLIQPSGTPARIEFTLDSLSLANFGDNVRAFDGTTTSDPLINIYLGNNTGAPAVAYSGSMLIVFTTDGANTASGWGGHYTSSATLCAPNTTYIANSASFNDGSAFLNNYANNSNCEWLIQPSNPNLAIVLDFTRFRTEALHDSVTIYDGATTTDPILGTYSGTSLPPRTVSSGNDMLITFKTNANTTARGWSATYSTQAIPACSGQTKLTAASDTLTDGSPISGNYIPNSNCQWLIQPPNAVSIDLSFNRFATQNNADVVTIYDGSTTSAPVLGTFSGNTIPNSVSALGGNMLVEFSSNGSVQDLGWEASYISSTSASLNFTQDTIFVNSGLGSDASYNLNSNTSWTVSDNATWLVATPLNGSGNQIGTATATQPNFGPPRAAFVFATSTNNNSHDTLVVIQRSGGNYLIADPDSLYFPALGGQNSFGITSNVNWQVNSPSGVPVLNPSNGSNNDSVQVSLPANTSSSRLVLTAVLSSSAPNTTNDTIFLVQDAQPSPHLDLDKDSLILNFLANSQGTFTVNSNVVWQASTPAIWLILNAPSVTQDTNSIGVEAATSNLSGQARNTYVAVQDVGGNVFDTIWVSQQSGTISLSANPTNVTLMQAASSNANVNVTSNAKWNAASTSGWFSLSPASDSGNANMTITALTANNSTSVRSGFIALADNGLNVFDTIWVDQLGIPKQLSVNPSNIILNQAAASRDSFMVNSNVVWQTLAGDPWLTLINPNNTRDTNKVIVVANSANATANVRSSFVVAMDTSGSLYDTVWVDQLGTNPVLSANVDTILLASTNGSSASLNLLANNDWFAIEGDSWFSATPLSGNSSTTVNITTNAVNSSGTQRMSYLAFADTVNNLNDTVIIIQDTNTIQGLSTNPDTIRLNSFVGSTASYDIIAPPSYQWSTSAYGNWITLDQNIGFGSQVVNVTANSANNSSNERITYILTTEFSLPMTNDSIVVIQEGVAPQLDVNPKAINLNFAAGSNDQLQVNTNLAWSVSNPVSWLSVNPTNDSGNTTVSITANTANLSGSIRSANLVFSATGVPDVIVSVNQVDGTSPSFTVSRDTVYVDNPQGSTAKFSVLANAANWTLSENTSWLLINPTSGSNTQEITVLAASRNVYGNPRFATITASDPNFNDTTVVVAQRPSNPLFQVAPAEIRLGGDSASFTTFNISSNLQNWTISKDSSWMDVSPTSGSFTQQVRVTATKPNNSGSQRTGTVSIFAPPLNPQTVMVMQDTIWSIGINENKLDVSFSIYPNPTSGLIYIEADSGFNLNEAEIAIYNNLGAKVNAHPELVGSNRMLINLQDVSAGFYFIQLNYEGKHLSKKISVLGQ